MSRKYKTSVPSTFDSREAGLEEIEFVKVRHISTRRPRGAAFTRIHKQKDDLGELPRCKRNCDEYSAIHIFDVLVPLAFCTDFGSELPSKGLRFTFNDIEEILNLV